MQISIGMEEFKSLADCYYPFPRIILDIGSMDGKDATEFATWYPSSRVIAIEGLQSNYDTYIKPNPKIEGIHAVIYNYDGLIDYHEKKINGIHGVFDRGAIYGTRVHNKVPCTRLDTLFDLHGISTPDMIKLDVEGATMEALQSMGKYLEKVKIMHIETEDYPFFKHQTLHKEVCKFLFENGFHPVKMTNAVIGKQGHQFDSIWVHNALTVKIDE